MPVLSDMLTLVPSLVAAAGEAAQAPAQAAWYTEGWVAWLVTAACLAGPSLAAWLLARSLRVSDMWGRIAVVLTALTCGLVVAAIGWPPRLGIDLKGGVILVYEVDAARRANEQVDDAIRGIERIIAAEEGLDGEVIREDDGRVLVRVNEADAAAREEIVRSIDEADFGEARVRLTDRDETATGVSLTYEISGEAERVDMDKLVAAVSRRVNPGGQKEVTVRRYGLDQIEVIVPDVEQSEVELIKRIVSSAGVLEFRITANPDDPRHRRVRELADKTVGKVVSDAGRPIGRWVELDRTKIDPAGEQGLVVREFSDAGSSGDPEETRAEVLMVIDRFNVTGGNLTRASSSYDQNLQPCVNFSFNSAGAALFGTLTGQNLPDPANRLTSRLGIVLDDTLLSAPTIRSAISRDGQITGNFKQADVDFLVGVLNAGSLPAALSSEPVSEQKISPQLGADTIRSGTNAMLLALVAVLVFMLAYYRFSGLVADLAVLLNVVLVVAVMISIKAAFTLAGLAGLVLSVGMAVDANVLIYERIREELDRGAAMRMAIRNGFQRAFSTIVDSNLTTLITGVVLYAIGTDQLKGFAVTLVLGLTLNLFTAVFCARVVFDLAERCRWIKKLSMSRLIGRTDYHFVAWMRTALLVSAVVIGIGMLAAYRRGAGLLDIDFTGGTSVQVAFKPEMGLDVGEVRKAVSVLPDAAVSSMTGGEGEINRRYKIDTSLRDADEVERTLREVFPGRLATYSMGYGEVEPVGDGEPKRSSVSLDFPKKINRPTLEEVVATALAESDLAGVGFSVDSGEADGSRGVRAKPYRSWAVTLDLEPDATRKVVERMATRLAETPVYLSANRIGGKVAGNTQLTALYALAASLLCIVLYIWLRFQNVAFGIAAVVALAHDVLVTVSALAVSTFVAPYLGWALVDDFKISLDVVAALLTIVGFSINDTIVIFDRLREIRGKSPEVTAEMVDRAVNQTLSRTILTSGTSLLATLILYVFGGQGIHAFAFTMLVGIITGTYSTVFIASPVVLAFQSQARTASGRMPVPRSA